MAKPYLPDIQAMITAGVDPVTGLPIKMASPYTEFTDGDAKKFLRIIDEQDFVNRFN